MKKLLSFLVMLCVAIVTQAETVSFGSKGSTYEIDGTTANIIIGSQSDLQTLNAGLVEGGAYYSAFKNVTTWVFTTKEGTTIETDAEKDVTNISIASGATVDFSGLSTYNLQNYVSSVNSNVTTIYVSADVYQSSWTTKGATIKVKTETPEGFIECTADELVAKIAAEGADNVTGIVITEGTLSDEALAAAKTCSQVKYIYFSTSTPEVYVLAEGGLADAITDHSLSGVTSIKLTGAMDTEVSSVNSAWKYIDLYGATLSDDNVNALVKAQTSLIGVILPLGTGIEDATLEDASGTYHVQNGWSWTQNGQTTTTLQYVVKFADENTVYLSAANATTMAAAVDAAEDYMANCTTLTTNFNEGELNQEGLSQMTNLQTAAPNVTTMVSKNVKVTYAVSLTSSNLTDVTYSNAIYDAGLTLKDCTNLTGLTFTNNCFLVGLTIDGCSDIESIDLKGCKIDEYTYKTTSGKGNDGVLTIENNAKLRYIIMPHNFLGTTDVEEGNTSLIAIVATRHTDTTTDENGNVVPVILANYTMYGGGVAEWDDMVELSTSQHYGHCTIFCMNKKATPNTKTKFYETVEEYSTGFSDGSVSMEDHSYVALTDADIAVINKFNADTLDLARTFYENPVNMVWANPNVKYLILPDNMDYFLMQQYTGGSDYPTMDSRLTGCTSLLGAVSYMGDVDKGNGNSDLGGDSKYNYGNIKGFMTYSTQPGMVNRLMAIPFYYNLKVGNDETAAEAFMTPSKIENIVCIGKMNAADLCNAKTFADRIDKETGNYMGYVLDDDKHMVYTGNSDGLGNCKRLDLTRAVFPKQTDMIIGSYNGFANLSEIFLPISKDMDTLPDSCLLYGGDNVLDSICIPGNYKHIGRYAFVQQNTRLNYIYTTGVDQDGNGYPARKNDWMYNEDMIIDMFDATENCKTVAEARADDTKGGCFTFSENLEFIGSRAFSADFVKDVYSMATTAPKCEYNAFSGTSYMNNDGYQSTAGAASVVRNNYGGGGKWMAYLHFPETCSDAEKANYTDLTRKYSIPDADGRTDGNGDIVMWPSQLEWQRSEAQAVAGVTWDFWKDADDGDTYKPKYATPNGFTGGASAANDYIGNYDITTWPGDSLLYTWYGYSLLDKTYSTSNGANMARAKGTATELNSGATLNDWVDDTSATYDTDYMGWHQFVLAYTSAATNKTYTEFVTRDWYTMCVPTDLTRKQVLEYFGAPAGTSLDGETVSEDTYPDIRTLYGVSRSIDNTKITFHFTNNLCDGQTWDFFSSDEYSKSKTHYIDANNEDDVVVYAGCPYIIKAIVPSELNDEYSNISRYLLGARYVGSKTSSKSDDNNDYLSYPKYDYKVTATRVEDGASTTEYQAGSDEDTYYYHFVGTYFESTIPQYAYYTTKKNGKIKWTRNMSGKAYKWNPYNCLMGALGESELESDTVSVKQDVKTEVYYLNYGKTINDDLFDSNGKTISSNYAVAFGSEDDEEVVTGITEVETEETAEVAAGNDKVYTIGGQLVNGKTLQKGIYIKNGRKFVVE